MWLWASLICIFERDILSVVMLGLHIQSVNKSLENRLFLWRGVILGVIEEVERLEARRVDCCTWLSSCEGILDVGVDLIWKFWCCVITFKRKVELLPNLGFHGIRGYPCLRRSGVDDHVLYLINAVQPGLV
jgi:hypothetical protein